MIPVLLDTGNLTMIRPDSSSCPRLACFFFPYRSTERGIALGGSVTSLKGGHPHAAGSGLFLDGALHKVVRPVCGCEWASG